MTQQNITCTQAALDSMVRQAQDEAVAAALAPVASKQPTGYYSTVRFRGANSGTAPAFLWTVLAGERKAFNYVVGGDMATAGFATGTLATLRHTNLSKAGETRAGETYYVKGVSYHLAPLDGGSADGQVTTINDPIACFAIWNHAFAQLGMNGGTDNWPLGPLFFFPAIAGLSGQGSSTMVLPGLAESVGLVANIQNGQQEADNYFEFVDPIIWTSSGQTDSQLLWLFTLPANLTFVSAARAAAAGVAPYEPPAAIAVDVTVRLIGHSISKLSVNR